MTNQDKLPSNEYAYGFNDGDISIFKTEKGLNEQVVREISRMKKEPEWMLEFRLKSLEHFLKREMPTWGVDLSFMNFIILKQVNNKKETGMMFQIKLKILLIN